MLISIFLIAIRCAYNIRGAINDGSRLNGKVKIATFGWARDNNCIGDGVDSTAVIITFNNKIKQIKFHRSKARRWTVFFLKTKKTIIGAETPDKISKLVPSNVTKTDINPLWYNNVKIISIRILIVWQYVSNFKSILSINFLPFNEKNVDAKINKIGKSPNNIILGGVKLMFW